MDTIEKSAMRLPQPVRAIPISCVMHKQVFHLPRTWTTIANRPREPAPGRVSVWTEQPGALISLEDAHKFADGGLLIMANRHFEDRVELVVRPAGWTGSASVGA
jgi:hypothetical protein